MYVATATCILLNIIQINSFGLGETDKSASNNETELERLLHQKQYILEQLVQAVEDGKTILKQNNDTLTPINLKHVQDLYQTLLKDDALRKNDPAGAKISATDDGPGPTDKEAANAVERRSRNNTGTARRNKEVKLHLFDFVSLTSKKNKHKDKEKELNRIIMQGKIDEWLLNRQLEKKKIKNYMDRKKLGQLEDCPRNGVSRKTKRSRTRRNDKADKTDKEEKRRRKRKKEKDSKYKGGKMYPCCRKCCKRSYMGCL